MYRHQSWVAFIKVVMQLSGRPVSFRKCRKITVKRIQRVRACGLDHISVVIYGTEGVDFNQMETIPESKCARGMEECDVQLMSHTMKI